jgi:hypothetical protein
MPPILWLLLVRVPGLRGRPQRVIVVPGIFFDLNPAERRDLCDSPCHHFVRTSYGPKMDVLKMGMDGREHMFANPYIYFRPATRIGPYNPSVPIQVACALSPTTTVSSSRLPSYRRRLGWDEKQREQVEGQ